MTKIKARMGRDGYTVVAVGHATGSIAACAGVSSLLYALAGWLENAPEDVQTDVVVTEPGDFQLAFGGGAAARTAFDMAVIGLAQIAVKHPYAVSIDVEKEF